VLQREPALRGACQARARRSLARARVAKIRTTMTLPHEHRLRVRYAETDQMGVVHHGSYVLYLEEARTRMLAELGCSYAELERGGIGLIVRSLELRYRSSAHYDEELRVLTSVERLRAASVLLAYEIRREGSDEAAAGSELVANGRTELACIDLRAVPRKPVLLPDGLRASLERGLAASPR